MNLSEKIRNFLEKLQSFPEDRKKIILWTIIVILAIPGGFFWIKDTMSGIKKIAHNISQMKIFETPVSNVPMPTIPTVTDQTAGWQTYTNNDYGFAFKYPKDFSVNTSPVSGLNVGLLTLSFKENITYPIWFYVGKSDDIKIKDKTTPSPTGTTNLNTSDANINGLDWQNTDTESVPVNGKGTASSSSIYYVKKGDFSYMFECFDCDPNIPDSQTDQNEMTIIQMISSFKFIK